MGTPDRIFAQVELMHEIGLAVPQVSELAHLFNTRRDTSYAFTSLEGAYQALVSRITVHESRITVHESEVACG
jgi:hypothetical protein